MTLHIQLRHKKVVEGAIVLLALLVLALSVSFSWQSYRDYRTDALAAKNSELADLLADAMEHYTLERGLTAAVLGAKGKAADSFRTQIAEARRRADSDWQQAMALAATLANGPRLRFGPDPGRRSARAAGRDSSPHRGAPRRSRPAGRAQRVDRNHLAVHRRLRPRLGRPPCSPNA